jgi:ribose-phosphate pyrophosphokinase
MIDTAGTISAAVRALKRLGAKRVYCCATHALLSGPARQRLEDAECEEVTVCNTIAIPEERKFERLKVLSVAELIAKAIHYTHGNESVSSLFETLEP